MPRVMGVCHGVRHVSCWMPMWATWHGVCHGVRYVPCLYAIAAHVAWNVLMGSDPRLSEGFQLTLQPGEMVYIPPGVWHEVRSNDLPTVSLILRREK